MSKEFAKLYEDTDIGQILVKIDSADSDGHEAEVRIYFEPQGFGVCSTAFSYTSWEDAEKAFDMLDQELCIKIINPLLERIGGFASE